MCQSAQEKPMQILAALRVAVFSLSTKKTERGIGVGTMGAVGAAAPTTFSQWVRTMYSAFIIIWNKNIFPDHARNTKG